MASTRSDRKERNASDIRTTSAVSAESASTLLKMVSDPTRMQILMALTEGKKSVRDICGRISGTERALNHHLVLLRSSKLVDARRERDDTYYHLTEPGTRLVTSTLSLVDQGDASPKAVIDRSEMKKLIKKVGTVVEDPESWLNTPNPQFEGRRPIDLIGTDDEERVHIIIEAAQQGCFA